MRLVWQTVWHDLYLRRRNFMLVLIVSVIALYLLSNILITMNLSRYQIHVLKNTLDKKLDYVHFEIIWNNSMDMQFYDKMAWDFSSRLKQDYPDVYGCFLSMNITFSEYQGEEEFGQQKVIYVDEAISDLWPVKDIMGDRVIFNRKKQDGLIPVYVGYALRDRLPVGTVITNTYTGKKMYVDGVLEEGSTWISGLLLGGLYVEESLDHCIFSPMDQKLSAMYFGNAGNSHYIKCDSKEEAKAIMQHVRELAEEYGILTYCKTINGWIEEEKLENKEIMESSGILTVFTVLIVVFAIIAASVADVYSRQYEFGIMYVHGVSSFQIFISIFLENMVKLCIAGGIAIYFSGNRLTGEEAYVHGSMVTPQLWTFIVAVGVVTAWISYIEVKKYSMTDFVGGAYR